MVAVGAKTRLLARQEERGVARTAPKQSYQAGYRPGRGEGEESRGGRRWLANGPMTSLLA